MKTNVKVLSRNRISVSWPRRGKVIVYRDGSIENSSTSTRQLFGKAKWVVANKPVDQWYYWLCKLTSAQYDTVQYLKWTGSKERDERAQQTLRLMDPAIINWNK